MLAGRGDRVDRPVARRGREKAGGTGREDGEGRRPPAEGRLHGGDGRQAARYSSTSQAGSVAGRYRHLSVPSQAGTVAGRYHHRPVALQAGTVTGRYCHRLVLSQTGTVTGRYCRRLVPSQAGIITGRYCHRSVPSQAGTITCRYHHGSVPLQADTVTGRYCRRPVPSQAGTITCRYCRYHQRPGVFSFWPFPVMTTSRYDDFPLRSHNGKKPSRAHWTVEPRTIAKLI